MSAPGQNKRPGILIFAFYLFAFLLITAINLSATRMARQEPEAEPIETEAPRKSTSARQAQRLIYAGAQIVTLEQLVATDPEPELPEYEPSPADVKMLAQMCWGEARGIASATEQAAVMWCPLNRVDSEGYGMGGDIGYVVTFPSQFQGYSPDNPTVDDYGRDLEALAIDVLTRWVAEKQGYEDVGRVLPKEHKWFEGDGEKNHFYDAYQGGNEWDWSLPSPYDS